MPNPDSQTFLRELDKKRWTAADRLRSNLDAAVYRHADLNLSRQNGTATDAKDIRGHFFSPNGAIQASLGHRPSFQSPTSRALKGQPVKRRSTVSISNPTIRRLAAMKIRGIAHILGTLNNKISFEDSAAGEIPKGWTDEPVGDVVDTGGVTTPSTKEPNFREDGTHHWTTPKDFSSLQSPILIDTSRKLTDAGLAKVSSGILPVGTVLLSSRAPVGYLAITTIPVSINQGFIALKCNDRSSNYFMLNWCQSRMEEIKSRASGITFAEISKKDYRPIQVIRSPKEIMAEFTAKVTPLYAQITANLHQSQTLATLRDTLLPQLLSGAINMVETNLVFP